MSRLLLAFAALAFVAGTSAASGAQRFSSYREAVWSPNGKQIAFINGNERHDIYVMNLDQSGLRRVTRDGVYKFGIAWSPNGKWIAYEAAPAYIYEVSPDGTQHRRLTAFGTSQPDFSPSGRRIAFASHWLENAIRVMYEDGTEQTPVTSVQDGGEVLNAPTWSPSGRRLAFAVGDEGDAAAVTPYLAIISQNGGPRTKLAVGHGIGSTDWSPDGQKILLGEFPKISVLDLRTRTVRYLGQDSFYAPRWSPSGRKILFTNEHGIFVMNSDGSHVRRLLPAR